MKINDATDIRIGTTQASKVYMGTVQVWPTVPPTPQALIEGTVVSGTTSITANLNNGTTVSMTIDSDDKFHLDSWSGTLTSLRNCFNNRSSIYYFTAFRIPTGNVTTMEDMFVGCSNMARFTTPACDVSNVTNINNMFRGCSSLSSLDLSMLPFSAVTRATYCFDQCTSLMTLNLNNWDLSNVQYMTNFFPQTNSGVFANNLSTVYINNSNTLNVLTNNLQSCGSSTNSWVYVPKTAVIVTPNHRYEWDSSQNKWV